MFKKTYAQIIDAIAQANHVLIVSHRKPDGDTIGSGLALRHYCATLGKPVTNFCIDPAAEYLHFLPDAYQLGPHNEVWESPDVDVVIVVDSGDLQYAGIHHLIEDRNLTIINIDHHVTNKNFGHHKFVFHFEGGLGY